MRDSSQIELNWRKFGGFLGPMGQESGISLDPGIDMKILAPLHTQAKPGLQSVEVSSSFQIPSFQIIGLPGPEVSEARERVRAAIEACSFEFPRKRITLNLSPASVRKHGTGLDLAMALSVLQGALDSHLPDKTCVASGELGLDGTIKPSGQVARALCAAWVHSADALLLAPVDAEVATQLVTWLSESLTYPNPPPKIVAVPHLRDAWSWFETGALTSVTHTQLSAVPLVNEPAPALMPLAPNLERILCASITGKQHLLLLGPKGSGKSHALEWMTELLPNSGIQARLHAMFLFELHSQEIASQSKFSPRWTPIRRVSQQVRPSSLIGSAGQGSLRPGEFSLAHGGILIADEFPEWARDSREAFREPLERGVVNLTRKHERTELPARFTLAATGNFCSCGGWPASLPKPIVAESRFEKLTVHSCRCSIYARKSYWSRLSGPILDRIDLVALTVSMTQTQSAETTSNPQHDKSHKILEDKLSLLREQIVLAQRSLTKNWGALPGELTGASLESMLKSHPQWRDPLRLCAPSSLRSRHKLMRSALTLSAWDGLDSPTVAHFQEASYYRPERFAVLLSEEPATLQVSAEERPPGAFRGVKTLPDPLPPESSDREPG